MSERIINIEILRNNIRIHIINTGNGINICIEGGNRPHIGATAIALPNGEVYCYEMQGHREGIICEHWAKILAKRYKVWIVISAGVHFENVTKEDIQYIVDILNEQLILLVENNKNG